MESLPSHLHFIGICGRAMGSLAIEMAKQGVRVTGSDQWVFPPMDKVLTDAGITYHEGFSVKHLRPRPDAVVISSYFSPANPEVAAVLDQHLPWFTLPAFLERYVLPHGKNIIVAGTNGKTTTTTMLAWIFKFAGKNPDYLIAGNPRNLPQMTRLTSRRNSWRVLEGDEYLSGLGDLNPKFLHYLPHHALVTNVHWDHLEVFRGEHHYTTGFRSLASLVPPSGTLLLNADDPGSAALAAARAPHPSISTGFSKEATHRITAYQANSKGSRFRLLGQQFHLPAHGLINVQNAAMAITMAHQCGISPAIAAEALQEWKGVEGRQEIFWQSPKLTVISEEAYHPHSLAGSIEAARAKFPKAHITVLLQPRYTGGGKAVHQEQLPEVLAQANHGVITNSVEITTYQPLFSPKRLRDAVRRRGVTCELIPKIGDVVPQLPRLIAQTDVLLISVAYRNEKFFAALHNILQGNPPTPAQT